MADLMAKKEYCRIIELKNFQKFNDNCIRVYMSQSPDVFTFQIRTHKPIQDWPGRNSKKRNMVATVHLTLTEMEQIMAYMKKENAGRKRVNTEPLDLIIS